jgi:pimeloyl-ACP methyl ester carboxylesterase
MYARVNGVQTWYDVRGAGEPLVLLHGGFSDSRDFEPNLEGLPGFRVHCVDRRGHGRTPEVPGPVSMDARRRTGHGHTASGACAEAGADQHGI